MKTLICVQLSILFPNSTLEFPQLNVYFFNFKRKSEREELHEHAKNSFNMFSADRKCFYCSYSVCPIGYLKFYFRLCAETVVVTPFFISYQTKTLSALNFGYFRSAEFAQKSISCDDFDVGPVDRSTSKLSDQLKQHSFYWTFYYQELHRRIFIKLYQ